MRTQNFQFQRTLKFTISQGRTYYYSWWGIREGNRAVAVNKPVTNFTTHMEQFQGSNVAKIAPQQPPQDRQAASHKGTSDRLAEKLSADEKQDLSKCIAGYWKHIARRLEVPNEDITIIENNHKKCEDQASEMILKWEELFRETAKIGAMCKALLKEGKRKTAGDIFALDSEALDKAKSYVQ